MPKNDGLDFLKSQEQEAFYRKQALFQSYSDARIRTDEAHNTMESAWKEMISAKDEMNREYEKMRRNSEHYREVWDEYGRIRDCNNPRIESLKWEADQEHQAMSSCFDLASSEYEYGSKAMASVYSQEGHEHKDRRDELNAEISALAREVKNAKQYAEWHAPKTDSSAFHRAKNIYESAKSLHASAQVEFKRHKSERNRLKAEFDSAHTEHLRLKKEYQRRLEEVKANKQHDRDKTLDKAGVNLIERKNAKIVKKADGTTQVYHGGLGSGDGLGHGHTALDQFGNKTYDRDAFAAHGHQNYLDDGRGVTFYERNARPGHQAMGIEGGIKIRPNDAFRGDGQDWYTHKKPGVIGHSTQFYDDGVRVSRDTRDGIHEENIHWTDERLPNSHPNKHEKPND